MKIQESQQPLPDPASCVLETLEGFEPEIERYLVGDAQVERQGRHYRIVSGCESWEELELLYRRQCRGPSVATGG